MSSANEKEYEINIDPRILELLGPNLYTNIYYILAELIANAYDAGARNVYVVIEDNAIIVEDDGSGMSYDGGDIRRYLNVAEETRKGPNDDYVRGTNRRKMGRKGVGKLAALSVSENVQVMTRKNGDVSGFILSRFVRDDKKLDAIKEDDISFRRIEGDGTSIVMPDPQYQLHTYPKVIKKNLVKMFPQIDADFKVHVIRGRKQETIESFDEEVIGDLCSLICLGDHFSHLAEGFSPGVDEKHLNDLLKIRKAFYKKLNLKNKTGQNKDFWLEVKGWIGAYKSTRGRKKDKNDFTDNFISLVANNKLGEYNILPSVGKNALNEVYIVGQLHVDLFEESTLPDMALSNRQGYKVDDPRYKEVIKYVRDELLPQVISMRVKYSGIKNDEKKKAKHRKEKEAEAELKKQWEDFQRETTENIAKVFEEYREDNKAKDQGFSGKIRSEINKGMPKIGLKSSVDAAKKQILISHTSADKDLGDVLSTMLVYNGVPAESIIYTSADEEVFRVPDGEPIFDYLKTFFVDSVSDKKIFVIYITSENMGSSWGALCEVGAGWITRSDHKVFNIDKFVPQMPLDVAAEWHSSYRNDEDELVVTRRNCDSLAVKVIGICEMLGFEPKSKEDNMEQIEKLLHVE